MIHLQVTVANAAELLNVNAYGAGALLRAENGLAVGGPFVEFTTVPLVSGRSVYDIWDPTGTAATWYRTRTSNAGATSFSAYSLPFQVPPAPSAGFCTLEDVKQRWSGDVPTMSNAQDGDILSAIVDTTDAFEHEIQTMRGEGEGWSLIAGSSATRRYTGRGASLLLVDDAVSVTSVTLIQPNGTLIRTLALGTDYLPYPINSLPIVGLVNVSGVWDTTPGGIQVVMMPGYCWTVPENLHKACIDEVIRTIRGGQVGIDDRAGTAPYGAQTITRSWLSTTMRTLYRYRFGGGYLRGGQ